ncbi:MAG: hypothetical protein NTW69_19955 [Chloroflexi bacterium]|nr:hypothetical protein [Chloroflexota bacterium]
MNTQSMENDLTIRPRRVLYVFGGVGMIVIILSFFSQYLRLFPGFYNIHQPYQADLVKDFVLEFDFNGQPGIAIYYNVLILFLASGLLFVTAHLKNLNKDAYRFYWLALAWIVLFFSIDNLAVIHEKIKLLFKDQTDVGGWSEYTWVIVGIVFFAVLFFRFWRSLDNKYRFLFFTSAILYFSGVLGEEITRLNDPTELIYSLFLTVEQGLQYAGGILLIYATLLNLTHVFPNFIVSIKIGIDQNKNK